MKLRKVQIVEPAIVHINGIVSKDIERFGWVSFHELQEACEWRIERFICVQAERVRGGLRSKSKIDLRKFVDLNYMPGFMNPQDHIPVPFTWIVCGADLEIHEFEMEDSFNCSFLGSNGYGPAKWAKRVLEAVGSGLVEIKINRYTENQRPLVKLYGRSVYDDERSKWVDQTYLLRI